jgi:hypothetical protein
MNKIILLMALLLPGMTIAVAQNKPGNTLNKCYRWRTQVDPRFQRIMMDKGTLTDREIEEGIGCLLELKGLKNKARLYGDTRINLNKAERYRPPKKPASVEIAALYYISYLFYNNWEHAGSIALYDADTGKTNTGEIVEKAFESYQKWYKKMLDMGIKVAREKALDPLDGSGISWS